MFEFQLTEEIPFKAEALFLKKDYETELTYNYPAIIFVREASLSIRYGYYEEKHIDAGQLFLLPRSFICRLQSAEDQKILALQVPNITATYIYFLPELPSSSIEGFEELFYPLNMVKPIHTLMDSILLYIEEKKDTNQLMGIKTCELFYFIKHCYTVHNVKSFFTPIFTKEYVFALFILSNYGSIKNAEELARLSNYTFSGFDKQFRKVFGVAPYKWILQKKIDKIYHEIYTTTKPIKVIAEECGFTNSSHLGNFCRKHLGSSPVFIRKRRDK